MVAEQIYVCRPRACCCQLGTAWPASFRAGASRSWALQSPIATRTPLVLIVLSAAKTRQGERWPCSTSQADTGPDIRCEKVSLSGTLLALTGVALTPASTLWLQMLEVVGFYWINSD
jgi:hypothetical protein